MTNPVGRSDEYLGDEAVERATGRPRAAWFERLDADGAAAWSHAEIARRLVDGYGVDGWWAQGITVAYEQARGIRRPGQRQDGTFEVGVSRMLALDPVEALRRVAAVVEAGLGTPPLALNVEAKNPTARFPVEGGEFVLVTISPPTAAGKVQAQLTRGRMADDSRMAEEKARMREWLHDVDEHRPADLD